LEELTEFINRQIQSNEDVNPFFRALEEVITIDEDFRKKVLELKQQGGTDIRELAHMIAKAVISGFFSINQSISPLMGTRMNWGTSTATPIRCPTENNFEQTIQSRFQKLAGWIARLYPDRYAQPLSQEPCIGHVIDNEYTVKFQTSVFGFHLDALQEPIIDIGCGPNAYLVRELMKKHKDVIGIDRLIETKVV
jgi:hypothetical protein